MEVQLPSGLSVVSKEPYSPPQEEPRGLMERARESRKAKEEKRNEGWKNFRDKIRNFFDKVKDVEEVVANPELRGEAIGEAKAVGREVYDAAKERGRQARERVSNRAGEIWTGAKEGWENTRKEMGRQFNEACNSVADTIDRTAESVIQRGAEMGRNAINTLGREVAAPLIEGIVIPAVQTIDEAHRLVADIGAGALETLASPIESVTSRVLAAAEIPEVQFIRQMGEKVRNTEGKKNWFRRMEERIGGWIDKAVSTSNDLRMDAQQLRADAGSVREWYNRNNQERVAAVGAVGQAAEQIKRGI